METSAPNATLRVSFHTLMAKFASMNVRLASTKMTVQAGAKSVRLLAKAVGKVHWIATRVMSKVSNHSSKKGDVCLPVKMAGLFPTKISTLFAWNVIKTAAHVWVILTSAWAAMRNLVF
jgi:hypothetical protein